LTFGRPILLSNHVSGPSSSARADFACAEPIADRERQDAARTNHELHTRGPVEIGARADVEHALTKARHEVEDAHFVLDQLTLDNREMILILGPPALVTGEPFISAAAPLPVPGL
jgi:hypothetical protein